jgi:hypothetical protein
MNGTPSSPYAFFPPPGFLPGTALPAGFAVSLPAALPTHGPWILVHYFGVTLLCVALLVGVGAVFKRFLPKPFAVLTGGRQRGAVHAPAVLPMPVALASPDVDLLGGYGRRVQAPSPQILRRSHRGPIAGALFMRPPLRPLRLLLPAGLLSRRGALPAGFAAGLPLCPCRRFWPLLTRPCSVGTGAVFKRLLPKAFAVLTGGRQRGAVHAPSPYALFPPPDFLPGAALPTGFTV